MYIPDVGGADGIVILGRQCVAWRQSAGMSPEDLSAASTWREYLEALPVRLLTDSVVDEDPAADINHSA